MRSYHGYAGITQRTFDGWRTFHSLQLSLNRRFRDGLSFGFNDTWVLYDHAIAGARLQHNPDGTFSFRDDQQKANEHARGGHPQQAHHQGELRLGSARLAAQRVRHARRSAWSSTTGSSQACGRRRPAASRYAAPTTSATATRAAAATSTSPVRPTTAAASASSATRAAAAAAIPAPVQHRGVPGPAAQQRRARVAGRLPARLFPERLRSGDRAQLQARRRPQSSSCGSRCSTRRTRRSSPGATRTMNLASPADPVTITNLPYDAHRGLIDSRSRPRGAGFGVATDVSGAAERPGAGPIFVLMVRARSMASAASRRQDDERDGARAR